jgi:hypothetical protein
MKVHPKLWHCIRARGPVSGMTVNVSCLRLSHLGNDDDGACQGCTTHRGAISIYNTERKKRTICYVLCLLSYRRDVSVVCKMNVYDTVTVPPYATSK